MVRFKLKNKPTSSINSRFSRRKGFLYSLVCFLLIGVVLANPVMALTEAELYIYGQNGIYFYEPDGGCTPASSTSGKSDGSDVYLIGDSISVLSSAQIKNKLPNITIDALSGTLFSQDSDFGEGGTNRISNMGNQDILVFAMGTNGGIDQMYKDDTEKLLTALKGKNVKVILMTIFYGNHMADNQMTKTNERVKELANSYSNISYFDWYKAASADADQLILDDNVHPTDSGAEKFANLITEAVNKVTKMVGSSGGGSGGGGYARLKDAVKQYGEFAMQMQIEYSTPWEVVLAQMQIESGVGTAGHAVEGADNNWLGITGSGDAGTYVSANGRHWAVFSSVEKSIEAWAGAYVLRNGYYNDAFPYLDPNNWDLEAFLVRMIAHYAPDSDGNNEQVYVNSILKLIDGPIKEAREEMGWLSSEEFAKKNNIPVGGNHPLDSKVEKGSGTAKTSYSSSNCKNYDEGGVISLLVDGVEYAFPIAHATKKNYLSNTDEHPSVLSSKLNGWAHHDAPAVDLGIYFKDITGKDFDISDYPQWNRDYLTDAYLGKCNSKFGAIHCNSSTGAPVVAITDGYVSYYDHYKGTNDRPLTSQDTEICASLRFVSTVGTKSTFLYIHLGYEEEFANSINKEVKAGEVIGHIGPSPCAQYTQAHLHLQTTAEKGQIQKLIDTLYDSLPEE